MKLEGKLELTWVGKSEEIKLEPRILVEDKTKSYGDPNTENMLIHGDNLLALKALEKDYTGKIKCIYIDPPYNADATGVPFDDNIEHSLYLNIMYQRILLLRNLLTEEGVFCMQCDYNEMAYLKILCDEIFGRSNYLSMITVKTSSESGVKVNANKPAKVSEYILMYGKDKDKVTYKTIRIITGYDKNYCYYITNPGEPYEKWEYINIKDVLSAKLNKEKKNLTDDDLRKFQIENCDRIFSIRDISDALKKFIKDNNIDKNKVFVYKTSTGKNTLLLKNGEIVFVKNKVFKIEGKEELTKIASDIWLDIAWDGIAKEGGVALKNSKKPERLIQRIFQAFTSENDIVMDSFLGSGTTCAVAQKMNRRWIGIELGDQAYTMAKVRIDSVINGNDPTGITNSENWQGGGGYKFYELAESLLVKNEKLPIYQINPNYTFEMMCEAICKIEGFDYKIEGSFHGKSSENRFIHITTEFVNAEYIKNLSKELSEKQSLLIYSTKFATDLRLPDNIVVKKIPKDLLKICKFESEVR